MSNKSGADGSEPAGRHSSGGDPEATEGQLFRSLRNRNYRLLFGGGFASNLGSVMHAAAQGWLVLELTRGDGVAAPLTLGFTLGLQVVPTLLFGLYGSLLADRFAKWRVLMVGYAVMGALALVLGVLTVTGAVALWHVYAFSFAHGLAMALIKPSAAAFPREVAGRRNADNANGLGRASENVTRVLGPAVAGVLIAAFGTGPVFLVNAATFGVVELAYLLMRRDEFDAPDPVPSEKGQLREGLRYVRERRDLVVLMAAVALVSLFAMNSQVTHPVMSREVFRVEASSFGLVVAAAAVGGVVGSLLCARRTSTGIRDLLVAGATYAALVAASGLMPVFWAYLAIQVPAGAALAMFMTTAHTLSQVAGPGRLRGRLVGLYILLINGMAAFGWPLAGGLSGLYGPRSALVVGGLAALASVAAVALVRRRPH